MIAHTKERKKMAGQDIQQIPAVSQKAQNPLQV